MSPEGDRATQQQPQRRWSLEAQVGQEGLSPARPPEPRLQLRWYPSYPIHSFCSTADPAWKSGPIAAELAARLKRRGWWRTAG